MQHPTQPPPGSFHVAPCGNRQPGRRESDRIRPIGTVLGRHSPRHRPALPIAPPRHPRRRRSPHQGRGDARIAALTHALGYTDFRALNRDDLVALTPGSGRDHRPALRAGVEGEEAGAAGAVGLIAVGRSGVEEIDRPCRFVNTVPIGSQQSSDIGIPDPTGHGGYLAASRRHSARRAEVYGFPTPSASIRRLACESEPGRQALPSERLERLRADVRGQFATLDGRTANRAAFERHLTEHPFTPDVFQHFLSHLERLLGEDGDDRRILARGWF